MKILLPTIVIISKEVGNVLLSPKLGRYMKNHVILVRWYILDKYHSLLMISSVLASLALLSYLVRFLYASGVIYSSNRAPRVEHTTSYLTDKRTLL